jgi:hypothetical protein
MEESDLQTNTKPSGSPPIPRPRPATHFTDTSNEQIMEPIPAFRPIPAPRPAAKKPCDTFIPQNEWKDNVAFIIVDNSNLFYGAKNMFKPNPVPFIKDFVSIIEKDKWVVDRHVASSGLYPQIIKSWEHSMYKVDNCESRGPEYGVDAVLQSKIRHLIRTNPNPTKSILVLVTGDGNRNSCSTSFPDEVFDAIQKGWHVIIYSWKLYTSRHFKELQSEHPSMMNIIYFDDFFSFEKSDEKKESSCRAPSFKNRWDNLPPRRINRSPSSFSRHDSDKIIKESSEQIVMPVVMQVLDNAVHPEIQEPLAKEPLAKEPLAKEPRMYIITVKSTPSVYEYTCGSFMKKLELMCSKFKCIMQKKEKENTIDIICTPSVSKKMDDFIHSSLDNVIVKDFKVNLDCPETISYSEICTMFAACIKYILFNTRFEGRDKQEIELVIIKVSPLDKPFMNIQLIGLPNAISLIEDIINKDDWKLYSQFVNKSPQSISNIFRNGAAVFHSMCDRNLHKFIKVYQTSYGDPNPGLTITSFIKEKIDIFIDKLAYN